ncbi:MULTISPECIES: hypothetical protein [unclassified Exiguobacterium]|uniref:hypothetical protein n=1 Tax=unclassified Exiguobacterium TaxID=2644629 RepID=UPI00135743BF|nr:MULTISPECIES: hypothetical protein [unclassified Exiguobacterium]
MLTRWAAYLSMVLLLGGCGYPEEGEVRNVVELYNTGITSTDDTLVRYGDQEVELKDSGGAYTLYVLREDPDTYWVPTGSGILRVSVEDGELDVIHDVEAPDEMNPASPITQNETHIFYDGNSPVHRDSHSQWCRVPKGKTQADKECFETGRPTIYGLTASEDTVYTLSTQDYGEDEDFRESIYAYDMEGQLLKEYPLDDYITKYGQVISLHYSDGEVYMAFFNHIGKLSADGEITILPWQELGVFVNNGIFASDDEELFVVQGTMYEEKNRIIKIDKETGKTQASPPVSDIITSPMLEDGDICFNAWTSIYRLSADTLETSEKHEWFMSRPKWGPPAEILPLSDFDPTRDIEEVDKQ